MLTVQDALKRAFAAFHSGKLSEAEMLCRAIIAAVQDCFDALHLLAAIQSRLGLTNDALKSYERALALRPDDAEALNNRGIVLTRLRQFDQALGSFERALEMRPDHADALNSRGVALEQYNRLEEALISYERALAAVPVHPAIRCNRANTLRELKRFDVALASYEEALSVRPDYAAALSNRGIVLHELQRYDEARVSCERALATQPDYADALNNLGNALQQQGRLDQALQSYDRALAIRPDFTAAFVFRAAVLRELGQFEEALRSYGRALATQPADVLAAANRADTLRELERFEEALATYEQALKVEPDHAIVLSARGATQHQLKQFVAARESYEWALAVTPGDSEVISSYGGVLKKLKRYEEALTAFDQALVFRPDDAEVMDNRGTALHNMKRFDEALKCYAMVLALKPDHASALNNRGNTLFELKQFDEALQSYQWAIAIKPDYLAAIYNCGRVCRHLKRFAKAIANYEKVALLMPDHKYVVSGIADCMMYTCDWTRRDELLHRLRKDVSEQTTVVTPFLLMAYTGDEALQLLCSQIYVRDHVAAAPQSLCRGSVWHNKRIKLAYVSSDFRRHPTAYLTAELYELHDRARFEVIGVSIGPDDRSNTRARLMVAFDHFIDVSTKSDIEIARLLNGLQIDIIVDLMGHTTYARPGIFSFRPAPIQINYLGFPGTTGADFIDYIIGDANVLPFDREPYYTEKIVQLPDCYQVTDRKRSITASVPTRQQVGLPADGFVFCCFNNNWKISPPVFDVWMRLLRSIKESVLWLLCDDEEAQKNLRREASMRGVDPGRLVLARRIPNEYHLARHVLADLFLDTLPYNAHTTASDALWLGLPVLTCRGSSFAGRVGSSLLKAVGLPELVTTNLADYELLALKLAQTPGLLKEFKMRLERNRDTCALFDTDRFRRNIESAYLSMWERWQRGEKPRAFSVASGV